MEILSRLIAIKSFDLLQNKEMIDFLEKSFAPFAVQIEKIKNPDNEKENLVVGLNCKLENIKPLVLSGHCDTVVADESKYDTNPFVATQKNGKLFGLGSVDMKCFFSTILDHIQQIKNCKMPIVVAITSDEETKGAGVMEVLDFFKRKNIKPFLTVVGEPTNLAVCTTSRTCSTCRVKIEGKSCHSSNPKDGTNAIYIASKFCLFVESLEKRNKLSSLSVGVLSGGEKFNIVAGNAYIEFSLRCPSLKAIEKFDRIFEKKCQQLEQSYPNSHVTYIRRGAAFPLQRKNEKVIRKIIEHFKLEETSFTAASEAGKFQYFGSPTIIFGAGDLALAHKPNEFLNLKNYQKYNKIFLSMLKFLDGQEKSKKD